MIDCHPMIDWPTGGPELSDPRIEVYRAEAWMVASHPLPCRAMLRSKDMIIDSCIKLSNDMLFALRHSLPVIRENGNEASLARAIQVQGKRWHLLLIKNVLEGLRGDAAHPWTWDPDAERNLDGF